MNNDGISFLSEEYGGALLYAYNLTKIFLGFWITMVAFFAVIHSDDPVSSHIELFVYGIFVSAVFTIFIGSLDLISKAYLYKRYGVMPLGIIQRRELSISIGIANAYDTALSVLADMPTVENVIQDKSMLKIVAIFKKTRKTMGEIMTIEFTDFEVDNTLIKISSEPRSKLALIDFGKNFENVEKVLDKFWDRCGKGNRGKKGRP